MKRYYHLQNGAPFIGPDEVVTIVKPSQETAECAWVQAESGARLYMSKRYLQEIPSKIIKAAQVARKLRGPHTTTPHTLLAYYVEQISKPLND